MRTTTLTLVLLTASSTQAQRTPADWLTQANTQQQQNQLPQAETSYRTAHALDPHSLPALTGLATVLQQEHQAAAAIAYWQQAHALSPADPQTTFSLATALLDNGDNQQAAALYRTLATGTVTNRGELLLNLGTALARLGQFDEAAHIYTQALAFPSVADPARLALIKALVTLLRFSDASPIAQQYLTTHPTGYEALYFSGLIDDRLGNSEAAARTLTAAAAADPRQFDAQLELGAVLRRLGRQPQAIPYLEQAVQLRPDARDAHFQLARAYSATGQKALAQQQDAILRRLEDQATRQTQVTVLGNQATSALDRHDTPAAIELYRQIATLDPTNARVRYDLAMLELAPPDLKQAQATEARSLLDRAHALDPAMPEVNTELGYLELLAGHLDTARAALECALQADPQSVQALGNLGVLDARQGQTAEAIHLLRLALDHDPAYMQGHLNLGLILAASGQLPEAATELEQALTLAPANPRATTALAAVRQQLPH